MGGEVERKSGREEWEGRVWEEYGRRSVGGEVERKSGREVRDTHKNTSRLFLPAGTST